MGLCRSRFTNAAYHLLRTITISFKYAYVARNRYQERKFKKVSLLKWQLSSNSRNDISYVGKENIGIPRRSGGYFGRKIKIQSRDSSQSEWDFDCQKDDLFTLLTNVISLIFTNSRKDAVEFIRKFLAKSYHELFFNIGEKHFFRVIV